MSSWHFYPDNFSSYEEYVKYLKEKGLAFDAPEGIYKEEKQMKALEAYDKIYLSVEKGEDWAHAMWSQKNPEEQKFSKFDEHEEYIRKKSLLEKLEKAAAEYKKRSDEGELVWQNMCGINLAIDILNKM